MPLTLARCPHNGVGEVPRHGRGNRFGDSRGARGRHGDRGTKRGPVTITHAFGQTVVPAPARRVVSAGFTEQGDLLAVGVVPIATTEWFGNEPFAVWPWAQPKLGGARPTVLS